MQAVESVTPDQSSTQTSNESASEQQTNEGSPQSQGKNEGSKETKAAQIKRLAEGDLDSIVTVKVNGETRDVTVKELLKLQQLEKASQSKMQAASKKEQEAMNWLRLAETNPAEFLRKRGIDPDEFAESTLAEKFELMKMSPEQKRLRELEQKEKEWAEREKNEKDAKEKEEYSRAELQELNALDKEFGEALSESGIKKPSKYTVAQIAARMLSASRQNKSLTVKEAAASVVAERRESLLEELDSMDGETLHEWLGKGNQKKFRDFDVERVSGKQTSLKQQSPGAKPASGAKKAFQSEQEWRAHMDELRSQLKD